MKPFWRLTAIAFLISLICSSLAAETWTVETIPGQTLNAIAFYFDGNNLTLNTNNIWSSDVHSSISRELMFAGDWAVCGHIDDRGMLQRDPYAFFIYNAGRDGGYVNWTNRPEGYSTTLLLGYPFIGDEAATYQGGYDNRWGIGLYDPVSGTLVIRDHYLSSYEAGSRTEYRAVQHSFNVAEPSSLFILFSGMIGATAFRRKR